MAGKGDGALLGRCLCAFVVRCSELAAHHRCCCLSWSIGLVCSHSHSWFVYRFLFKSPLNRLCLLTQWRQLKVHRFDFVIRRVCALVLISAKWWWWWWWRAEWTAAFGELQTTIGLWLNKMLKTCYFLACCVCRHLTRHQMILMSVWVLMSCWWRCALLLVGAHCVCTRTTISLLLGVSFLVVLSAHTLFAFWTHTLAIGEVYSRSHSFSLLHSLSVCEV